MNESDKYVPFTDVQKTLMEAPADDSFSRCKRDFFLKVGRDMVCSDHQELHKRLLSLDPQNLDELNAVKAIFNNGRWLDKDATKAMIGLLTVMKISPNSVSEKTRDNLDSDSRSTLIFLIIAVFFAIPILACFNRDVMIVFGAGYFAAFPIALALHSGLSAFIGFKIYNAFFDKKIVEDNGYNAAAYNDKLLLHSQFGFNFEKNICENILFPFFDIDNYIQRSELEIENKSDGLKKEKPPQQKQGVGMMGFITIFICIFIMLLLVLGTIQPWTR